VPKCNLCPTTLPTRIIGRGLAQAGTGETGKTGQRQALRNHQMTTATTASTVNHTPKPGPGSLRASLAGPSQMRTPQSSWDAPYACHRARDWPHDPASLVTSQTREREQRPLTQAPQRTLPSAREGWRGLGLTCHHPLTKLPRAGIP
jgi:hypothetical protein